MITRADVIYYAEQRFNCKQGRPYKSQDLEGMNRYVTLIARGELGHRCAQMLNALSDIADRMPLKPVLWWRYRTKLDDSTPDQCIVTRLYIEGCNEYGKLRHHLGSPPYLQLAWSKPALVVELKDQAKKQVFPVLTFDPDPQPPRGVA